MSGLKGKTALVTGAGSTTGIGYEVARRLGDEGATVIISGRDAERGEAVAAELGGGTRFVTADLEDPRAVEDLAAAASSADVLVNNAAVMGGVATPEQTLAAFDEAFAVNVRAAYFLTAALAPRMAGRGGGSIINITSMAAQLGMPGLSIYGSTKAALESLTKTWAAEFASDGVRVNSVAPGPTRSGKVMDTMAEDVEALGASLPLARMGLTEEIAEVVVFLAGDRSSYVTGASIAADGGRTAV